MTIDGLPSMPQLPIRDEYHINRVRPLQEGLSLYLIQMGIFTLQRHQLGVSSTLDNRRVLHVPVKYSISESAFPYCSRTADHSQYDVSMLVQVTVSMSTEDHGLLSILSKFSDALE